MMCMNCGDELHRVEQGRLRILVDSTGSSECLAAHHTVVEPAPPVAGHLVPTGT
jgi:hypothetical protein